MRFLTLIAAILLACPGARAGDDVPRTIDDDGPEQGVVTPDLQELWRVGGEDGDIIFGRISDVKRHPGGDIYVLDNQLCQVVVLSAAGAHLRDLSREGEGPGELRQPVEMVFLPDDLVGVALGYPGKLVTMTTDGTPVGTLYPVGETSEGNLGIMMSAAYADGRLVASGGRMVFSAGGNSHTAHFLAVAGGDLSAFHRILETETPLDPTGRVFDEAASYSIDGRWALDADGRIYAPMVRDTYAVSVFDTDGHLLRVFGRRYTPRSRTRREMDAVRPRIRVNLDDPGRDWRICDHDECIARIQVDPDDGTVWVLTPQGTDERPDGILESWDVFSPDGAYLRRVSILLGGRMREGTCYLVGGGRLVVVKGSGGTLGSTPDDDDPDAPEPEALEVICYAMR